MNTKFKKIVTVLGLALVAGTTQANPITSNWTFSGESDGGTGSANMHIEISSNTLTLNLFNTSPTTLNAGTHVIQKNDAGAETFNGIVTGTEDNAPGIVGFGFNLSPDRGYTDWILKAFNSAGNEIIIGSKALSGNGVDTLGEWKLGDTQNGVTLDYLPLIENVKGALYNPDALAGLAAQPNYFTQATLTMVFDGLPILSNEFCANTVGGNCTTYVRMKNVGLNGEGSLKLGGEEGSSGSGSSIPEPSNIALIGLGLVAFSFFQRRRTVTSFKA